MVLFLSTFLACGNKTPANSAAEASTESAPTNVAETTDQCFDDNECSSALTGLECYYECLDAFYTNPANQCLCDAGCETAKDFEVS